MITSSPSQLFDIQLQQPAHFLIYSEFRVLLILSGFFKIYYVLTAPGTIWVPFVWDTTTLSNDIPKTAMIVKYFTIFCALYCSNFSKCTTI